MRKAPLGVVLVFATACGGEGPTPVFRAVVQGLSSAALHGHFSMRPIQGIGLASGHFIGGAATIGPDKTAEVVVDGLAEGKWDFRLVAYGQVGGGAYCTTDTASATLSIRTNRRPELFLQSTPLATSGCPTNQGLSVGSFLVNPDYQYAPDSWCGSFEGQAIAQVFLSNWGAGAALTVNMHNAETDGIGLLETIAACPDPSVWPYSVELTADQNGHAMLYAVVKPGTQPGFHVVDACLSSEAPFAGVCGTAGRQVQIRIAKTAELTAQID